MTGQPAGEPTVDDPPAAGAPGEVIGEVPSLSDVTLRQASADLLVKREDRGRDVTTAMIGQVAVVGSFLGAFNLLGDAGKVAVVQSGSSQWALIFTAISLGLSLSTYFLLPARMPSLDKPGELRDFWNNRVRIRRALLFGALIALSIAIYCAMNALSDARSATASHPAGSLAAKFSAVANAPSSLEVTANWRSLEPGRFTLLCVNDPNGALLSAASGSAGSDGVQTTTLTMPVMPGVKGAVQISTLLLEHLPVAKASPAAVCESIDPTLVAAMTSSIITIG